MDLRSRFPRIWVAILRWFQELSASPKIYHKSISMLAIAINPCNSLSTLSKSQICLQTSHLFRFRFMNQKRTLSKMVAIRVMKKCRFQMDSVTTTSRTCIKKRPQLKLKIRCVSHGPISLDETQSSAGNWQVAAEEDRKRSTKKCSKDNERQIKSIQNRVKMRTIKSLSSLLPVIRMRHKK